MGSSSSKAAKSTGAVARKYPTRTPPSTTHTPISSAPPPAQNHARAGPTVHPPAQATDTRTEAINLDARDPVLASRLNTLGAVQPNPHYSPSSTSSYDPQRNTSSDPTSSYSQPSSMPEHNYPAPTENPALRVLSARQRIQDEADAELAAIGRKGFAGRRYVDAGVIQLALMRKARGEPDARIEQALSIERGRLGVLGRGVFGTVSASN